MNFYSTNNRNYTVDLRTAVMHSFAPDRGLYMPENIPTFPKEYFETIESKTFTEIGIDVTHALFQQDLSEKHIIDIVSKSINFEAPIVWLNDRIGSLELWHGPSLAFKDFGARYMAQMMSHFNADENKLLTILVATSGDTGGAVAFGFLNVPGIEVVILYPKGKVSMLQEKQLTTLGGNIHAVEVDGTFDDCQEIVKTAFLDNTLNAKYRLTSANSINIARLIPQSFYYLNAYAQVKKELVIAVPSGNFGNLTAGILAKKMGMPVKKFIAATNANHIVPDYLITGQFIPMKSIATLSNAMDVGNPSNFVRLLALYHNDHDTMTKDIVGHWSDDTSTFEEMKIIYQQHNYITEPHGAVAYRALSDYLKQDKESVGIFLETAHPAKFIDVVEKALGISVAIPDRLAILAEREKSAIGIQAQFEKFRDIMMAR